MLLHQAFPGEVVQWENDAFAMRRWGFDSPPLHLSETPQRLIGVLRGFVFLRVYVRATLAFLAFLVEK